MAVFRIEKNKNYTVMANYHLRDISLSLKAKGLLSLMLSLPEGWDYTTKGLACICKDGVDSIVYSGSDGNIARITRADFSSEEEFLFWKSWSDADYKETDYADSYFHRHTVGLDTIGDNAGNIPSPEEVLLYKTEREEQVQEAMELVQLIAKSLTKVQFRRLWLHHVQLENVRTIAKAEGVAHPSIVASITSAQRKILKIVQKHATKTE